MLVLKTFFSFVKEGSLICLGFFYYGRIGFLSGNDIVLEESKVSCFFRIFGWGCRVIFTVFRVEEFGFLRE